MASDIFAFDLEEQVDLHGATTEKPQPHTDHCNVNDPCSLEDSIPSTKLTWPLIGLGDLPNLDLLPWIDSTDAAWQPWSWADDLPQQQGLQQADDNVLLDPDLVFDYDWPQIEALPAEGETTGFCDLVDVPAPYTEPAHIGTPARPPKNAENTDAVSTPNLETNDGPADVDKMPTETKSKRKRTRICDEARLRLENEFFVNPYPADEITILLATQTGLPVRTVKTWFTNARSRKRVAKGKLGVLQAHVDFADLSQTAQIQLYRLQI
jgi:hypothetical protein